MKKLTALVLTVLLAFAIMIPLTTMAGASDATFLVSIQASYRMPDGTRGPLQTTFQIEHGGRVFTTQPNGAPIASNANGAMGFVLPGGANGTIVLQPVPPNGFTIIPESVNLGMWNGASSVTNPMQPIQFDIVPATWYANLPSWLQFILRWIFFGWIWMN